MSKGSALKSTGTICGHCDAPVNNGYLCSDGVDDLRQVLADLSATVRRSDREPKTTTVTLSNGTTRLVIVPGHFARRAADPWSTPSGETMNLPGELRSAAAKMVRFGTGVSTTKHDDERPHPVNHIAADRGHDLNRVVARWVATMIESKRTPPQRWTTQSLAVWIDRQLHWVRLQEWAPKMLDELQHVADQAIKAIDRPADRMYLGTCGQVMEVGSCQSELIATPGDSMVRCPDCGATTGVAERRSELLDRAMGMLFTATEIERISGALAGEQVALRVPRSNIRNWHRRGQLLGDRPYYETGGPAPRFLLREVLALAERSKGRQRKKAAA